ncbi:diguanylate cyclase [Chromobacterium haemolyticum]|nr:diguanylate cyclase [Chromobacterium haemolyticum]
MIHQPYEVNDHLISVGVSIGIAYYPEDGLLIDELLTVADRKMYGNKREIAAAGAETA